MPTVFKIGSKIFFFTSYDCSEPMHIHVVDGNKECKFWLIKEGETELSDNHGFNKTELSKNSAAIKENFSLIKKTWYEHCKNTKPQEYKNKGNK